MGDGGWGMRALCPQLELRGEILGIYIFNLPGFQKIGGTSGTCGTIGTIGTIGTSGTIGTIGTW